MLDKAGIISAMIKKEKDKIGFTSGFLLGVFVLRFYNWFFRYELALFICCFLYHTAGLLNNKTINEITFLRGGSDLLKSGAGCFLEEILLLIGVVWWGSFLLLYTYILSFLRYPMCLYLRSVYFSALSVCNSNYFLHVLINSRTLRISLIFVCHLHLLKNAAHWLIDWLIDWAIITTNGYNEARVLLWSTLKTHWPFVYQWPNRKTDLPVLLGESLGDDLHNVKKWILKKQKQKTKQKCKIYWKKYSYSSILL